MSPASRCLRSILTAIAVLVIASSYVSAESPVTFSRKLLLVSPNEGCAVGDVNNDGKPDIVAGTHWYAAPDFVPRAVREIPEFKDDYLQNNADMLHDVDGDGWLDVISGGWAASEIHWYKNPGAEKLVKGLKWEQHLLKDTRGQNEIYQLKDLDDDGVPEIFVNCWLKEEPVVAWKFAVTDTGEPTLEQRLLGNAGGGHGYAFGDINGNGREDVLVETGWYERPEGDPWAAPWKFHAETALPHPSCPCLIVDLTGDGRNDILWGKAHDFGLFWNEQGEPTADGVTTWTTHTIDTEWSQAHALVWADLDGDDQPELITGKRVRGHAGRDPGGSDPACLFYYTWNRNTGEFTRHAIAPIGAGVGTGMQICVGDLNADGRPDVAVSGKTGTWLLLNEKK